MDTPQALRAYADHTGGGFLPILAALHVYDTPEGRRIQAGNGRYYVDGPTELPVMTVDGGRLLAAFNACRGDITVTTTDANVMIKSGRVKARVPLLPTEYPRVEPTTADRLHMPDIVDALALLLPFVAEDASRPWATAICLSGAFAYATNNVVLARCPLTHPVSQAVNIPGAVASALVAKGPAEDVGYDGNAVTFYYPDRSWVRTNLITGDWPVATVDAMLAGVGGEWVPVPDQLGSMLTAAAKLSGERHPVVEFHTGQMALTDGAFTVDDMDGLPPEGKVAAKMAALALEKADAVQWHTPKKDVHAFRRGQLTGILGGTR